MPANHLNSMVLQRDCGPLGFTWGFCFTKIPIDWKGASSWEVERNTLEKEIWTQHWFWWLRRVSSGATSAEFLGTKDRQWFWGCRTHLYPAPGDCRNPESHGVEKRGMGSAILVTHVQRLWLRSTLRRKGLLPGETLMVGWQVWGRWWGCDFPWDQVPGRVLPAPAGDECKESSSWGRDLRISPSWGKGRSQIASCWTM